mmetsp:Transcript_10978/g.47473  ORF Transcript_10978/g.47473 Transcript_10978/m.47473 type:complete len:217 (-) Transcript_10978:431-1081(-)
MGLPHALASGVSPPAAASPSSAPGIATAPSTTFRGSSLFLAAFFSLSSASSSSSSNFLPRGTFFPAADALSRSSLRVFFASCTATATSVSIAALTFAYARLIAALDSAVAAATCRPNVASSSALDADSGDVYPAGSTRSVTLASIDALSKTASGVRGFGSIGTQSPSAEASFALAFLASTESSTSSRALNAKYASSVSRTVAGGGAGSSSPPSVRA